MSYDYDGYFENEVKMRKLEDRHSGTAQPTESRPNEETEGLALKAIRLTLDKAAEICDERVLYTGYDCAESIRSLSPEDILKELK